MSMRVNGLLIAVVLGATILVSGENHNAQARGSRYQTAKQKNRVLQIMAILKRGNRFGPNATFQIRYCNFLGHRKIVGNRLFFRRRWLYKTESITGIKAAAQRIYQFEQDSTPGLKRWWVLRRGR